LQLPIGFMLILLSIHAAGATPGKFYIVGMGTAPDLITVRGVQVIKSADIILLEQPSERDYWKDFIGDKEVWYCPHGARVGYGLDPKKVEDPDLRACGSCHDGRTKGTRGRLFAASIQNCSACHMPSADIVITLNRMDPAAFSHIRHLGVDPNRRAAKSTGFSCSDCHPALFERASKGPVGMEVPHESGGCAQCHNGQKHSDGMPTAFAANTRCLTCHKPSASSLHFRREAYQAKNLADEHSKETEERVPEIHEAMKARIMDRQQFDENTKIPGRGV
jgi:c(7)-type cytochrome triheme protein